MIKGTRLTVDFILELLANEWSYEEILENYPQLEKKNIFEVTSYAGNIFEGR